MPPVVQNSAPIIQEKSNKKWKKFLIMGIGIIILLGAVFYLFRWWAGGVAGGGGSEQFPPETVKTGSPAIVKLVVNTWGGGGSIEGRFTNLSLSYKLTSESSYKIVQPKQGILPANYTNKDLPKTLQYEAYEFTIPPYPKETTGEIEYYIEMTFDGYPSRQEGLGKIKLIDASTTPINDTTQSSVGDYQMTGTIQSVVNKQPVDGDLRVMINDRWVIIGGGEMQEPNNGVLIGFDLNVNPQIYVGKTAEVYAKNTGYDDNLTILGDNKYYLKIIK